MEKHATLAHRAGSSETLHHVDDLMSAVWIASQVLIPANAAIKTYKKAHVRMYRNTLLFDSETIGGGQRRPRPGGRSHARCPKRRECGKPQLEPRWHSHGRYDKGAIEFREQIWHWLIREHSSPGGRPTVALWRGTAAPHCFGGCVQVDRRASGRVGPEAKREWQHAVVRDN